MQDVLYCNYRGGTVMIPTQALPIYRAKKIDSDEWVEGVYSKADNSKHFIFKELWYENEYTEHPRELINGVTEINHCAELSADEFFEINPLTLAVHYTNANMEDSEGTKIFASLSSDGNGGDICDIRNIMPDIAKFEYGGFNLTNEEPYDIVKVTGIHTIEGEG